ncbi:class I SAM-dependent methyltransferase [Desulfovibrio aminophilus]|uniref:class I SAM-dependent methyltransferase n=1 Tax=Desulfovibrio aminophilus TaxID=81425 RepID=UPI0004182B95|nr:class I SAM-dependent methyltransferase [Desulfovibrio aminophilus]
MTVCPLCDSPGARDIWNLECPAFQNKTYPTPVAARSAAMARVDLACCPQCGFVFNRSFAPKLMDYDQEYQNEQGHSPAFRRHLAQVLELLGRGVPSGATVVEVGCGKGLFLGLLRQAGYRVTGFDPSFEGDDPGVVREYFGPGSSVTPADLVVLRHTLEHVPDPRGLLATIAQANQGRGLIYVEVPCFDWIRRQRAFWDVFHEHVNYFTRRSLGALWRDCSFETLFQGQYLGCLARLEDLLPRARKSSAFCPETGFPERIASLATYFRENPGQMLWGAGAKGASLLNLVDPGAGLVAAVIDINPRKQLRYIAHTAHPILPPESLAGFAGATAVAMNHNYLEEIRAQAAALRVRVVSLEDLTN